MMRAKRGFARDTSVSVAKSRGELEDLVHRAGGTKFGSMYEDTRAVVLFELGQRRIMFELPLPARDAFAVRTVRSRRVKATPEQQQHAWEQACRSKWRALCLAIKAKLVSVETGVESFEQAFLAQIVVPHEGRAVRFGQLATKAIAEAYTGGTLPPLLGSGA